MTTQRLNILLVEDNPAQARMIQTMLTEHFGDTCIITTTASLDEAMQAVSSTNCDVILLNLALPDSSHLNTFLQMNRVAPMTPIIILTTTDDDKVIQESLRLGAQDFFYKHELTAAQLGRAINNAIQRKKLENVLRESESRYLRLFEDSLDTIFECDIDGNILNINPAGVQMFGYNSFKEMCRLNVFKHLYFNPADKDKYFRTLKKYGKVTNYQQTLKRKNGSKLFVHECTKVVRNAAGEIEILRGIFHDITAHVKNQKLLEKMNDSLKNTNRRLLQSQTNLIHQEKLASIGQLAAGIAHELNNPLGFIANNFSTLKNYMKNIRSYFNATEQLIATAKKKVITEIAVELEQVDMFRKKGKIDFIFQDLPDLFDESSEGFNRIISIVQSLRSFSHIDSIHEIEAYDLNAAIHDTLVIAGNQINYVAETIPMLTEIPQVECRGDEINQVLLNIILNAAQAIESQQRDRLGKIIIRTYRKGNYVCCEIADDGPGIRQEHLHRIFDPFFTTKDVGKGTGLGLNIAYDIVVNKHQGDLLVNSSMGKGTTFLIKLPIQSPIKKRELHYETNRG